MFSVVLGLVVRCDWQMTNSDAHRPANCDWQTTAHRPVIDRWLTATHIVQLTVGQSDITDNLQQHIDRLFTWGARSCLSTFVHRCRCNHSIHKTTHNDTTTYVIIVNIVSYNTVSIWLTSLFICYPAVKPLWWGKSPVCPFAQKKQNLITVLHFL